MCLSRLTPSSHKTTKIQPWLFLPDDHILPWCGESPTTKHCKWIKFPLSSFLKRGSNFNVRHLGNIQKISKISRQCSCGSEMLCLANLKAYSLPTPTSSTEGSPKVPALYMIALWDPGVHLIPEEITNSARFDSQKTLVWALNYLLIRRFRCSSCEQAPCIASYLIPLLSQILLRRT